MKKFKLRFSKQGERAIMRKHELMNLFQHCKNEATLERIIDAIAGEVFALIDAGVISGSITTEV